MSQDSNLFKMSPRLDAQGKQNSANSEKWDDGSDQDNVAKIYIRGDCEGIRYIGFDYIKSGKPKYKSFHGMTDIGFTRRYNLKNSLYLVFNVYTILSVISICFTKLCSLRLTIQ